MYGKNLDYLRVNTSIYLSRIRDILSDCKYTKNEKRETIYYTIISNPQVWKKEVANPEKRAKRK